MDTARSALPDLLTEVHQVIKSAADSIALTMENVKSTLPDIVTEIRQIKTASANRLTLIEEWLRIDNANINTRGRTGQTPLHNASAAGDCELVELLLEHRAEIGSLDNENNTPLHVACTQGYIGVVKLLVEHGANVNSTNRENLTPLHEATEQGYHDIVEYLLASGASITCDDCYTPLDIAAKGGHAKVVAVLLKHGAGNQSATYEQTPLALAAANGHHEIVSLLLQNNVDVDSVEEVNTTPLYIASSLGHVRVVEILLNYAASIDRESLSENENDDAQPNTALDVAAKWENKDVVALLLKRGAKIVNSFTTSLHHAAFGGSQAICEDLIEAGAAVNAEDAFGQNSLHCASSPECVRYLISQGADVHKRNNHGMSPLHTACATSEREDVIVAMLEGGSDVHSRDDNGRTPLHLASTYDFKDTGKVLLEWGADIHCRHNAGCTPLHLAAKNGAFEMVKFLIESGSDINLMSNELHTALDYANAVLGEAHDPGIRNSFMSTIAYLNRHVMLMRSVNMYLRPCLLKDVQFKRLHEQCLEELASLKATYIGNSDVSYYKFLGKSIDQIVLTLKNPKILEALNSGWFKTEFPNFGILIGSHFNWGNVRKQIIDKVFENCSEVFTGLLEECVHEILSFLSNKEVSMLADGFAEPQ